jgi:two-component system NtrC family sensor kinase
MQNWSGTARKLLLGFGALVFTIAVASFLTLAGVARIHGANELTKHEEEGVRRALELASAVRDQYAHQAHTIIIGNESHLGFYSAAERHVLELTKALRPFARGPEECGWMDDIEHASADLDGIFRQRIVPAVVRGDRRFVQTEHARAQRVVTSIQDLAEQLVGRFEARIANARAEVSSVERRTNRSILALLIGAPLLAAGITFYVGRSIAKPIAQLSRGAERIAAGDLDTKIDIPARDEFGALARQFNAMTASLKEHQTKLLQSEKLATVGRLAAGVAHEINNPLAVILGYVRLLRKRVERSVDDDLAVVEEETLRCKEIVVGLLDLSRPQQGGQDRVDLRSVSEDVVERFREAKVLEGIDVTIEGDAVAEGHPSKIRQVVGNLVRNAAEAAGPGGHVTVGLSALDGEVRMTVHDSGAGLDARARERLFEPFFTTKERGTGLGLAVSRAIARAHGGDIEVSTEGAGATFTVKLPRHEEKLR